MELKTKRLRVIPLHIEQMALLCEGRDKMQAALGLVSDNDAEDEHAKADYQEMYQQCREHPEDYFWYTNWQIVLKDENKAIGSMHFHGPANARHEVEVAYGISGRYQKQDCAAEALKAIGEWAFSQNVYYLQTKTDPDNEHSKGTLGKCGFKQIGTGDKGLLFELEKPASAWMSIYMCLGMSIGMCFGLPLNNMAVGMCMGLAAGVALGAGLDADDRKKRKRD